MPSKKHLEWSIRLFKIGRIFAWTYIVLGVVFVIVASAAGLDYTKALIALGMNFASVWMCEHGIEKATGMIKNKEYSE